MCTPLFSTRGSCRALMDLHPALRERDVRAGAHPCTTEDSRRTERIVAALGRSAAAAVVVAVPLLLELFGG